MEMENYYYYSYYCSYVSVLTGLCSTIVLKTWNVDNVRNPLVFYNFDIRFPFGVYIPEKKKLHHFIKHCKSKVFSRLAEKKHPIKFA